MASAYPRAPGKVDIGSDAMRAIPVLYSPKHLVKYYSGTVLSAITNTDYEGEIKKHGDTVYIRTTPDITIRDYQKGQSLVNEQPTSTAVTLQINKGKYWSFVTDDVDMKQTDIKDLVNRWSDDGAEQMKITIDTDVLGNIGTDAHASNQGATAGVDSSAYNLGATGSPFQLTKANVIEKIVECGSALDEQDVPETGRFILVNPLVAGLIKKSDLKNANQAGDDTSIQRHGRLGMIDRFTVYSSNLLAGSNASNTGYQMLFGHKDATTFATQLTESKMTDNPNGFGMLYRGLQVYGYKVVKPEGLGVLLGYV